MIWNPRKFVLGMDATYWLIAIGEVAVAIILLWPRR